MRSWIKRSICLMLAAVTMMTFMATSAAVPAQAAASGADALVEFAVSQDGKTGKQLGFPSEWCAYFVAWSANKAGLQNVFGKEISKYTNFPTPKAHAAHMLKTGRGDYFYFQKTYKSTDNAVITSLKKAKVDVSKAQKVERSTFMPKKGDLICFLWEKPAKESTAVWSHIGIVTGADSKYVYYVDGNTGNGKSYKTREVIADHKMLRSSLAITSYIRPHYCTHTWGDDGVCTNKACGAVFEITPNYTGIGSFKVDLFGEPMYAAPYKTSKQLGSTFPMLKVTGLYNTTNAKKEKWWYVRCGSVEGWMQDSDLTFDKALESKVSFSGMRQPAEQTKGGKQNLGGTISSTHLIKSVKAEILDGSGKVKLTSTTVTPMTLNYSLYNTAVDTSLKFEKLAAGDYQVVVTVTDVQGGTERWASRYFAVQAPTAQTCGAPKFTESGYEGGKKVTITSSTAGATIKYSYNGKSGSGTSPVSFNLTEAATITATASKSGMKASTTTATVVVGGCTTPVITEGRTTMEGREVVITGVSGETIYYSIDDGSYVKYEKPFFVTGSSVIRAYAAQAGSARSATAAVNILFSAPEAPEVSLLGTAQNIPVGNAISAQWEAVPYATHYIARLCLDGEVVETRGEDELLTETAVSFAARAPGRYTVEVVACNAVGESDADRTSAVTAHAPLQVTFVNDDGTVLAEQTVRYGDDAIAPSVPVKRGYTFSGWDESLRRITEDTLFTATYEINEYTIRFYDCNGYDLLGRQTVEYGEAIDSEAMAARVTLQTGHSFVGWHITDADSDSLLDLEHIDSDMTLVATQQWEIEDLPIVISNVEAVRNADSTGYDVDMDISCAPASVIGGDTRKVKLIVTLKSKYEQMLATSIETINLTEDTQDLSRSVFVSYDGHVLAERAEVIAIGIDGNDRTGGALSELAWGKPTVTNRWSQWMTREELEAMGRDIDDPDVTSKTQYRYTDATRATTTRTSSSSVAPVVDGYDYLSSSYTWGSWSAWSDTPITATSDREVRTQLVTLTHSKTQYRYGRWSNGTNTHFCPSVGKSYYGGTWSKQYTAWMDKALTKDTSSRYYCGNSSHNHVNPDHKSGSTDYWYSYKNGSKVYFWQETKNVPATYKTQYSYRDKTYTHTYEKWTVSTPSAWSDNVYTEYETNTGRREVETREVYRYITGGGIVVDTPLTSIPRTCRGTLDYVGSDVELEGKLAAVLVYKETNSDPTEPQLEFVGQTTIGAGNTYEFSYLTKEEPSEATGDFIVALALQGSSNVVNADIVLAPTSRYLVSFYDLDGKLLRATYVDEGEAAPVPEVPQRDGYRFVCWDHDTTYIQRSIDVNPIYVPEEYSVVFADFANGMVSLDSDYSHGDMLLTPDTPTAEGMVFEGWKVVSNATGETLAVLGREDAEAIEVTEDLIVTAQWTPVTHIVRFMDLSGEVLEEQIVEYGTAAQPPEQTDLSEGMIFAGWSNETEWWNVTADMDVYPVAVYAETTTAPIHTGEQTLEGVQDTIELLCDEGASIYYTIDGSDPVPGMEETFLYEDPIEVTESTTIRAIAVEENKNASQIIEVFFWYMEEMEAYPNHEAEHIGTYNVAAAAGEKVAVEFKIENNPGLAGYLFYIDADPSVFTVADDYVAGTMCGSGTLLLGPYTEGLGWQLLWFGSEAAEGDGILCRLTLEVKEDAANGVYPIKVGYSPANTFDNDFIEQSLPGLTVGFSGSVEYRLGDVNNDGTVSSADVVMIARSIVQLTEIPAERVFLADVNHDGMVTLADAIYLARYIIGLEYLL